MLEEVINGKMFYFCPSKNLVQLYVRKLKELIGTLITYENYGINGINFPSFSHNSNIADNSFRLPLNVVCMIQMLPEFAENYRHKIKLHKQDFL